jgi:NDP-sugar pyrophosphorylase family protein
MKAMILAAGEGTRLRPLTNTIPKCMVPLHGKPLLEWNLRWLAAYGFTDVVINLFYLPEVIRAYFQDGQPWGVNITYSEETEQLGTAGGVKKVQNFFDEPFLVLYGDNLSNCDLRRLTRLHHSKGGMGTMGLIWRDEVSASGIVGLDERDQITRFMEKPKAEQAFSHWVNAGVYYLSPRVFDFIPEGKKYDFGKDVFPELIKRDEVLFGYRFEQREKLWWIDTPVDLDYVKKNFIPKSYE